MDAPVPDFFVTAALPVTVYADLFLRHFRLASWVARACLIACIGLVLATPASAVEASGVDQEMLSLEELLQTDVQAPSTLARQVSDSPAAVAIVTAEDIRAYGYRTLAEVINSMRGLYTTSDRNYDYMGGRGFGKPGDFVGRVMLLIDGYATQDNLYNQAYIDQSALVDLDLVERVEYVPGTGSVIYGNNALLGIINVVTKKGAAYNSVQLSTEAFSFQGTKQRLTYGQQLENGADLLLSASSLKSRGQDHYFRVYDNPATSNGLARHVDDESASHFFAKLSYQGLTLSAAYAQRDKTMPFPRYYNPQPGWSMEFGSRNFTSDENAYLRAQYETDLSLQLKSLTHFYHGSYRDQAERVYDEPIDASEKYRKNRNIGQWWGLDQKFVGNWFANHTVLFGAEFRHDYQQVFEYFYLARDRSVLRGVLDKGAHQTLSFYATDEYVLNPQWRFNLGARYDTISGLESHTSPRAAVIYTPNRQSTWKLSYSEAFRQPNADDQLNYGIKTAERVAATELVHQYEFSPELRVIGSVYNYRLSGLTYTDSNGDYRSNGASHTDGVELEIERRWGNAIRLRSSVARQQASDLTQQRLVNSPDWLGKFNLTFPLWQTGWRTGLEAQYLGQRLTATRRQLPGVTLFNLTFSSDRKWYGFSASASIRNLFDTRYEVVAPHVRTLNGVTNDSLQMDGRTFWLQLQYDFPVGRQP